MFQNKFIVQYFIQLINCIYNFGLLFNFTNFATISILINISDSDLCIFLKFPLSNTPYIINYSYKNGINEIDGGANPIVSVDIGNKELTINICSNFILFIIVIMERITNHFV